jgi:hypothetical protein
VAPVAKLTGYYQSSLFEAPPKKKSAGPPPKPRRPKLPYVPLPDALYESWEREPGCGLYAAACQCKRCLKRLEVTRAALAKHVKLVMAAADRSADKEQVNAKRVAGPANPRSASRRR